MFEIAHLLMLADEFERVTRLSDTTLSSRMFKDSKKLAALRSGSDITTVRFNDAVMWFSENWPEGAEWPSGMARPRLAA